VKEDGRTIGSLLTGQVETFYSKCRSINKKKNSEDFIGFNEPQPYEVSPPILSESEHKMYIGRTCTIYGVCIYIYIYKYIYLKILQKRRGTFTRMTDIMKSEEDKSPLLERKIMQI
jgi:hypothetical protein